MLADRFPSDGAVTTRIVCSAARTDGTDDDSMADWLGAGKVDTVVWSVAMTARARPSEAEEAARLRASASARDIDGPREARTLDGCGVGSAAWGWATTNDGPRGRTPDWSDTRDRRREADSVRTSSMSSVELASSVKPERRRGGPDWRGSEDDSKASDSSSPSVPLSVTKRNCLA